MWASVEDIGSPVVYLPTGNILPASHFPLAKIDFCQSRIDDEGALDEGLVTALRVKLCRGFGVGGIRAGQCVCDVGAALQGTGVAADDRSPCAEVRRNGCDCLGYRWRHALAASRRARCRRRHLHPARSCIGVGGRT